MLEENTYWALQYNRWIDNFAEFKKVIQPEGGGGIGFNVNSKLTQRKVSGDTTRILYSLVLKCNSEQTGKKHRTGSNSLKVI